MKDKKLSKKLAFYKRNRKKVPGITNDELRSMWLKKVEEDAKEAAKSNQVQK